MRQYSVGDTYGSTEPDFEISKDASQMLVNFGYFMKIYEKFLKVDQEFCCVSWVFCWTISDSNFEFNLQGTMNY